MRKATYEEWISRNDINKVFEEANKLLKEDDLTEKQREAVIQTMDGFKKFLEEYKR